MHLGHKAKQEYERMPLALNVIRKKRFCVLQKKVLSFGPNRIVEVRPNSSAKPSVGLITTTQYKELAPSALRFTY